MDYLKTSMGKYRNGGVRNVEQREVISVCVVRNVGLENLRHGVHAFV
jgi:hypothetical protein